MSTHRSKKSVEKRETQVDSLKNAIKNIGKNKSKIIRAIRKMQADLLTPFD